MAGFVVWFSMLRANISPPLGIIAVVLGSLLPDIDHPNGTIRQMMDLPRFLKHPISTIIPHRGPTHTVWAGILFFLLAAGLAAWGGNPIVVSLATGIAMFIRYSSHLILDSLNPTGVKWVTPWKDLKLHGPIRTGGREEEYFFYGLIGMLFLTAII